MRYIFFLVPILLLILLSCSNNNEKENTYAPIDNWPKIPSNLVLGNPTGLALKSNQNLVVFHRASRSWQGQSKITTPRKENDLIEVLSQYIYHDRSPP